VVAALVVAHGAWSAGWAWKKMRPLMRARGHEIFTPTYTGLGERAHLAAPAINLDSHIRDMLGVLEYEDLTDVVLIGHSYGGMVATGVADRARGRIKQLIYLDAFAPEDGKALHDYMSAERREATRREAIDGWRVPPPVPPPDTSPEDLAWIEPRRVSQPLQTFEQALRFRGGPLTLPRSYIYCARNTPSPFRQFLERAKKEGWPAYEIDASHSPNVTAPELLAETVQRIVKAA
jgi:pimeloyl-ACP methyl ester carboxylesterase